jgi:hypothetical protein
LLHERPGHGELYVELQLELRTISRLPPMSSKKPKLKGSIGKTQDIYDKLHCEKRVISPSILSLTRIAAILLQVKPHLAAVGPNNRSRVLEDLDQVASLAYALCQARNATESLPFADDLDLEGGPFFATKNKS